MKDWPPELPHHWSVVALSRTVTSKPRVVEVCGGYVDDLACIVRSVAAVKGELPAHQPQWPQLLEGLAVVIGNLARRAPVVIFLDDVHLADASSWQAIDYLARNLPEARVLLIAAARPGDLSNHQAGLEVLLLRRGRSAGFVPGAYVFPGGRVDAGDADPVLTRTAIGLDESSEPTAERRPSSGCRR